MENSYSEHMNVRCHQCGEVFEFDLWLIVDTIERLDLTERIRKDALHDTICPYCGELGSIDAPLLIYQQGKDRPLLFSPAQNTTAEQDQQQAIALIEVLDQRLGDTWQNAWATEGIQSVSHQQLSEIIEAEVIHREADDSPQLYDEDYRPVPSPRPLIEQIQDYFQIPTWNEQAEFIEQHPDLLSDEADALLTHAIESALARQDKEFLNIFLERHEFIKRIRAVGSEEALFEKIAQFNSGDADDSETLIPHEFEERLIPLVDLLERYKSSGDQDALSQAISIWSDVIDDPHFILSIDRFQAITLNDAGISFLNRYDVQGHIEDLDHALTLFQRALDMAHPFDQAGTLNNLGNGLRSRYTRIGNLTDLERSIQYIQQAVDLTAPDSPELASFMSNLGVSLRNRYARTGKLADLERALELHEESIRHTPADDPARITFLNNMIAALNDRYTRTGDMTDLNMLIQIGGQAVRLVPPHSPDRGMSLDNLAIGLRKRFVQSGNIDDLNNAIELHRQAVELPPLDSPEHILFLSNFGIGLHIRYLATHSLRDLEDAIQVLEQAVHLTPSSSPARALRLSNLATLLNCRYDLNHTEEDLERAIQLWQQAADLTSTHSPSYSAFLLNLANGLSSRYTDTGDQSVLDKAIECYQQACHEGLDTNMDVALKGGRAWGRWALQRTAWREATQAFNYILQTIDQLFRTQLFRSDKESWLRQAQGTPACAAYAFARSDDLTAAVVTLEIGCTRLLTEALERNRADLERLQELDQGDLYVRYRAAVERVLYIEAIGQRAEASPPGLRLIAELRTARADLNAAIDAIQHLPDYADFFRPPDFAQIQQSLLSSSTVKAQAAVYIAITPVGGVALIISASGIHPVWLDFTEADLDELLVRREDDRVVGGYLQSQLGVVPWHHTLEACLRELGERLIRPVAAALEAILPVPTGSDQVRPVILLPTGRLALFPLHTVSYKMNGQERCFLDDFVVSYTPSAKVFGRCHETLSMLPRGEPNLFGIGNPLPLPDGIEPLAFARPEVETIALLFRNRVALLYESQATRSAVESRLGVDTYLHLSCHGQFKLQDPLESGVILSGGEMITLRHMLARPLLRNTRLVVLSACQTAITDFKKLPEEAIGLAAGFLQAGAPGMVGTLWPVNDLSAALLMIQFYQYHLGAGPDSEQIPVPPAQALRRAQLWLRDVTNAELYELFTQYSQSTFSASAESRTMYKQERMRFRDSMLSSPEGMPFAHPEHWAPFVYYGT